jgi:hypothetical protein
LLTKRGNDLASTDLAGNNGIVVALVLDLMFGARVRGVAPGARLVRDPESLAAAVGPGTRLVLVDLQVSGALQAVQALSDRPAGTRIVAWGPHVMEEALAAARAAGADVVLPRGAFVKALPQLVADATA